jgi:hypothetical protein
VLVLIDLVQDIEVMLPVALALRASGRCRLDIVVSRWLEKESPRTGALLRRHRLDFRYVRRLQIIAGKAPSLRGLKAVIAASESSHPAHAAGHALAQRAAAAGLSTYAVQHGLENVGLFGHEASAARFASKTVFCWFPESLIPSALPAETRARLVHVGRPAPPGGWAVSATGQYDVGVFENLHWERYGEPERQAFRQGLFAMARELPDLRILLRTHPAGAWSDELSHELAPFTNITAPRAAVLRQNPSAAADILGGVARVITTPSTIALDAALAGRPAALAVDGGDAYLPLPVLHTPQDWIRFASGTATDASALDQFRSRVLVAGDGAPRIAERVIRAIY